MGNIIFLACDAFGVLPPVVKPTKNQAMFHFLSGYTAKVAGTEIGVKEPVETFSACFGEAFLVHHPSKYCELLKEKIEEHGSDVWLVNTGWVKGPYGTGERISLKNTRAIIDGIHSGELANAETETLNVFDVEVPKKCTGVPEEILLPYKSWNTRAEYDAKLEELGGKFLKNFENYREHCSEDIRQGGPQLSNQN